MSLRTEDPRELFGILLHRFASSPLFIYSTMHLHQNGLTDIYFTFWVITQYHFVAQTVTTLATGTWVGMIPWRRKWEPTPVFFPEESHEQRSLAGYSPWRLKESETTEVTWHACTTDLMTPLPSASTQTGHVSYQVKSPKPSFLKGLDHL